MKLRTIVKIAVISSVVLLCTGFAVFSFFKLSAVENREDFNLYTLVPPDATVVFETDDLAGFIDDVNRLDCSKDQHYLRISRLFAYLKQHLHTLLDDTPHGLSKQMNKVLLSFHEPENDRNQVLYCSLGDGDYQLVEKFIQKYCSSSFPSKLFDYKGEEIRIYPLSDDSFLACYMTSDFLVVSYQKKLIEEVINARLSKKSLLHDPSFKAIHAGKKGTVAATLYTRANSLEMGDVTDGIRSNIQMGGWMESDMKLNGGVIYFSGISHDTDTCLTFMNMLRKQQPAEEFPGYMLPSSTFFFCKRSATDMRSIFDFSTKQEYTQATYSNYLKERDMELVDYIEDNADGEIVSCLFQGEDSTAAPHVIVSFLLKDVPQAEQALQRVMRIAPKEKNAPPTPRTVYHQATSRTYAFYPLPRNTLFTQLTGITGADLNVYACIYDGRLLMGPNAESLSAYIRQLDKKQVLENTAAYEEGVSRLAPASNLMMMTDLSEIFRQPEAYVRLVPNFFFRNQEFFRHFILAAQFVCADGIVYPNIVLLYKGK